MFQAISVIPEKQRKDSCPVELAILGDEDQI